MKYKKKDAKEYAFKNMKGIWAAALNPFNNDFSLNEKGLRDKYLVLVGGAPLNEEFSKSIGADAYCRDAAVAVETAKELMKRKHNQLNV